jgi:putative oxidoreductase
MASTPSRVSGLAPWVRSVLRIVAAFVFMQFGTAKLFGFPGPLLPGGGTVPAWTFPWFAGVLETFGGALVLIGLFTRPVAFVLSGEMAAAYFLAHAPKGFWPVLNEGHPAVLFCFVWLYFAAAGAGPLSVDAALGRGPKGSTLI